VATGCRLGDGRRWRRRHRGEDPEPRSRDGRRHAAAALCGRRSNDRDDHPRLLGRGLDRRRQPDGPRVRADVQRGDVRVPAARDASRALPLAGRRAALRDTLPPRPGL